MVEPLLVPSEYYGNLRTSMYNAQLQWHIQACYSNKNWNNEYCNIIREYKQLSYPKRKKKKRTSRCSKLSSIIGVNSSEAYPVLQASLIILTESAVTTKASAQARCPMCGFGSIDYHTTYKLDDHHGLVPFYSFIQNQID